MTRRASDAKDLWLRVRALPTICAGLLIAAGVFLAIEGERRAVKETAQQTDVQARILAATVTGALAFDDSEALTEYLGALKLNPQLRAVAVYDLHGARRAGFRKDGGVLPPVGPTHDARVDGLTITTVTAVQQGRLHLGTVYVETNIEPLAVRLSRYLAVGLIIALAATLIWLLGRAYARTAHANSRLREEIAAREQAEQALVQSQKMEALGQLTGGIAHDFNNLLMAAGGGVELLERTTDPAKRTRIRDGIRDALDRGTRITRQLLVFARRSPVNVERVDLTARVAGISEVLERSLRQDINVRYEIAEPLWPVCIDPTQFEVALINLAVNARDAMPEGGTLTFRAENLHAGSDSADAVSFEVIDTGTGMSDETRAKVFDPFFTTKAVGKGTGLGLSQVYGFVQGCGGQIEVVSALGQGTTVRMRLPRDVSALNAATARGDAEEVPAVMQQKVLVVEDDPVIGKALVDMLSELGCSGDQVNDVEAALSRCGIDRFDIVLSDMVMPGELGGLDLARRLSAQTDPPRVVLMSGYTPAAEQARAEGYELLDKPFGIAQLARVLSAKAKRDITADPVDRQRPSPCSDLHAPRIPHRPS